MIVVADNLRITLPAVGRAVERFDPEPIRQVVSACMVAGAQAIPHLKGRMTSLRLRIRYQWGNFRLTCTPFSV